MTKLEMFDKVEDASLFYPSVGPGPFTLVKFATMSSVACTINVLGS
jgi:hypothetical protein